MLCELCLPFVKVGGLFLAMKGESAADEVQEAQNALRQLGAQVERLYEYPVADAIHRVVVIRKTRPTPGALSTPLCKNQKSTPLKKIPAKAGIFLFCLSGALHMYIPGDGIYATLSSEQPHWAVRRAHCAGVFNPRGIRLRAGRSHGRTVYTQRPGGQSAPK